MGVMDVMTRTMRRRTLCWRAASAGAALLAAPVLTACGTAGVSGGAGGAAAVLYVANGLDGTVSQVNAQTGHLIGPPFPAGPAPAQLVAGPGGTLVVLPAGGPEWRLSHVTPSRAPAPVRAMPLEPGGSGGRLIGDDQGGAVLLYHLPVETPEGRTLVCRLALLDVSRGVLERTHTICASPDVVVDAALEEGPRGPVAYLAIQRPPALLAGRWRPGSGRVLAVDAQTGAALGVAALPGTPRWLRLAPAPGPGGQLLYCLVGGAGSGEDSAAEGDPVAGGPWRLLGLDPLTLRVEREHLLPRPLRALRVAPDGSAGYALDALVGREVVRLDLRTGATRRLATLPRAGADLVVTRERIYVADRSAAVWALDRHGGALAQAIDVGRGAVGLALSRPA